MALFQELPLPTLDALPMGAHRLYALTDEALFGATGVRVAFTGREGGVSEGAFSSLNLAGHVNDDPSSVAENRALLLEALGCPGAPLVTLEQVHGTHIVDVAGRCDVTRALAEGAEGADGVVVDARDVAALVDTADCLPLIVVSPSGRFALAHAGWRGAVVGMAGKAVARLVALDLACGFRADAEDVRFEPGAPKLIAATYNAYIGPHIRSECFEVGEDVAQRFADAFSADVLADARHVSLERAVRADLVAAGLRAERIASANVCTVCACDRYFSYRASGGVCGRNGAIAVSTKETR